jgi:hypothetical protein
MLLTGHTGCELLDFTCQCGATVYFENVECLKCGRALGFDPVRLALLSLEPEGDEQWVAEDGTHYRMCRNTSMYHVCNWLVPEQNQHWCRACRLNKTIPNLDNPQNLKRWHALEAAKRRLLYSLFSLRLPVIGRNRNPRNGLGFMFLEDTPASVEDELGTYQQVTTGHSYGMITINLAEADPASREQMREQMNEPYRTLLGHFRHESGHYYWKRLIRRGAWLNEFRKLFGDERTDYSESLQHYYQSGPAPDWSQHYVSAYASAHPWEDWAETWAHYLHMTDTLETAFSYGLIRVRLADETRTGSGTAALPDQMDFFTLCNRWVELTLAMNALNRSMGQADAYPFVLSADAVGKLHFVHRIVAAQQDPTH